MDSVFTSNAADLGSNPCSVRVGIMVPSGVSKKGLLLNNDLPQQRNASCIKGSFPIKVSLNRYLIKVFVNRGLLLYKGVL